MVESPHPRSAESPAGRPDRAPDRTGASEHGRELVLRRGVGEIADVQLRFHGGESSSALRGVACGPSGTGPLAQGAELTIAQASTFATSLPGGPSWPSSSTVFAAHAAFRSDAPLCTPPSPSGPAPDPGSGRWSSTDAPPSVGAKGGEHVSPSAEGSECRPARKISGDLHKHSSLLLTLTHDAWGAAARLWPRGTPSSSNGCRPPTRRASGPDAF